MYGVTEIGHLPRSAGVDVEKRGKNNKRQQTGQVGVMMNTYSSEVGVTCRNREKHTATKRKDVCVDRWRKEKEMELLHGSSATWNKPWAQFIPSL